MKTRRREQTQRPACCGNARQFCSMVTAKALMLLVMLIVGVQVAIARDGTREKPNYTYSNGGIEYLLYKATAYDYHTNLFAGPSGSDDPKNGGFNTSDPSAADYLPTKMVAVVNKCSLGGNVTIPSSVIYNGETYTVISLGYDLFLNNTSVTSLTIPSSVRIIEHDVFNEANGIRNLVLEGGEKPLFCYYSGNSAAYFKGTFTYMSGLQNITIGRELKLGTTSDYYPFYSNTSNANKSITIPSDAKRISAYSFTGLKNVKDVIIESSEERIYMAQKSMDGLSPNSLTLGRNVLSDIPSGTFDRSTPLSSLSSIKSLTIDEGCNCLYMIEYMPESGRYLPTHVSLLPSLALDVLNLTNARNLTEIPDKAFIGSTFETVKIPSTLVSLGASVFENCTNLKTFDLSEATSLTTMKDRCLYNTLVETLDFSKTKIVNLAGAEGLPLLKSVVTGPEMINIRTFWECPALEVFDASLSTKLENVYQMGIPSVPFRPKVVNLKNTQLTTKSVETLFSGNYDSSYLVEFHMSAAAEGTPRVNMPYLKILDLMGANSLTTIQKGNFYNLEELYVPESVQEISDEAFYRCDKLKKVTFAPNTRITRIGKSAFYGCTNLEALLVEGNTGNFSDMNSLAVIDDYAFRYCEKLTSVSFPSPAAITRLGAYAFANTGMSDFDFSRLVNLTAVSDGLLSKTLISELNLPNGITGIGKYAYSGTKIKQLVVPANVTSIGAGAFSQCKGLVTADMSACTHLTELPDTLFSGCTVLHRVDMPSSITKIGTRCFDRCEAITNAGDFLTPSTKYVGIGAFAHCTNLTNADFSNCTELTTIPDYIFSGCTNLTTYRFPAGITSIGSYAFWCCKKLTDFDWSAYQEITTIGRSAFAETGIKRLVVPDKVTSIGDYTFDKCENLESITFGTEHSQLTSLGISFVGSCPKLKEIRFANATGITEIPNDAFLNNESLETFDFENLPNLTTIGDQAFRRTGLVNAVLSDKVESIGVTAFAECSKMKTLQLGIRNSKLASIGEGMVTGSTVENIIFARNEQLTEIPRGAFRQTENLKSFDFGNLPNVKSIAEEAFQDTGLESIVIPTNVTSIGEQAFCNCQSLKTINLANLTALTTIGNYAFYNTGMVNIVLPDNLLSIGTEAFADCANLRSLQIGISNSKISTLGNGFVSNTPVESVTFKNATLLTAIPATAFMNNHSLKQFDFSAIPNLTTIGDQAFYNSGLTSAVLNDKIATLGSRALANCPNLMQIQFGTSSSKIASLGNDFMADSPVENIRFCNATMLTTIPDNTFRGRKNLQSFDFASLPNLTTIGNYAFYDTSLREVTLGDNVTTVGEYAFARCTSLYTVTLGKNCRHLGSKVFWEDHVARVNLYTDITSQKMDDYLIDKDQFEINIFMNSILCLEGTNAGSDAYKSQQPWKQFQRIFQGDVMETTDADGNTYKLYRHGAYSYDIKDDFGVHNIDGAVLVRNSRLSGDVDLPDQVRGFPVIAVAKGVFNEKSNITSISFPGTLRMIENNAVEKMSNLKKVEFRDQKFPRGEKCYVGYAVYSTEDEEAFYKCDALEEVVIGCDIDWEKSEDEPFEDRDNLKRIRITAGCHTIGKEDCVLFNDCDTELDELIFDDCETDLACPGELFSHQVPSESWADTSTKNCIIGRTLGKIGTIDMDKITLSNSVTKLKRGMIPQYDVKEGAKLYGGKNVTEIADDVRLEYEVVDKPWVKLKRIGDHVKCPENLWADPANPWESSLTHIGVRLEAGNTLILPPSIEYVGEGSIPFGEGRPEGFNQLEHVPDIVNIYIYADLAKLTMGGNVWDNFEKNSEEGHGLLARYVDDVTIHCLCNTDMDKIKAKFPDASYITSHGSPKRLRDLHLQESKKGSTLQSDGLYHDVCANCGGNDRSSKTGNYYIHNWNGTDDIMIHKDGSNYTYAGPLAIDDSKPFLSPVSFSAQSVSYNRTVTGDRVATFVLPFAADASDVNGTVYKFREFKDSKFCFDEQTGALDANTPYLVVVNEDGALLSSLDAKTLSATVNSSLSPLACNVTNGSAEHVGSFVPQTLTDGDNSKSYYGYSSTDGAFVKAKTATLNPFRTMFALPSGSQAKRITLQLGDDQSTGIINVDADLLEGDGSPMYDLNGRIVTTPVRGQVYIQDGRKIVKR